ncbi:MAG: pirin family protein [Microscillaceae bacterium]|nr:pirin family protein [Microscillaceae bacterium]
MKIIKKIHTAAYHPIADLITYSPLPSPDLSQIDPFLFLNHHGPQVYAPDNQGLPFGPHPHRGMETVTFILSGDVMHQDSGGHESIIKAGGVQWMTAGRGLMHAEVSSPEFKKKGGPLEILQLWLNLPARLKMTEPFYLGLQKEQIPSFSINDKVHLALIAGQWEGNSGAFQPQTDVFLGTLALQSGGSLVLDIPASSNVFFYLIKGALLVNGQGVAERQLVEFGPEGSEIAMEATQESLLLLGHATPFQEPIVAQGPFVMNTIEEIQQAYRDYQMGKFGVWNMKTKAWAIAWRTKRQFSGNYYF